MLLSLSFSNLAYSDIMIFGEKVGVLTRTETQKLSLEEFYEIDEGSLLHKVKSAPQFDKTTIGAFAYANQVIVKLKIGNPRTEEKIFLNFFNQKIELSLSEIWRDYYLINAKSEVPLTAIELTRAINESEFGVLFDHFEPNVLGSIDDLQYGEDYALHQWSYSNLDLGEQNGGLDYDIDSDVVDAKAIARRFNNGEVIVAVLDSGINVNLALFKDRLWQNTKEIPSNGIDDDQNGYIDDIYGFDFFAKTGRLADTHAFTGGHGTAVSAIVAANPETRIDQYAGVADNARIMTGIITTRIGNGWDHASAIRGVGYAADNGADVLNLSFSTTAYSRAFRDAIQIFTIDFGGFVVASAGNAGDGLPPVDVGITPTYPCNYASVYCVASSNRFDEISSFSNYQTENLYNYILVDAAAPGDQLRSVNANGGSHFVRGTSFAAPLVSGAVALLKGVRPNDSNSNIWRRLNLGAEPVPELKSKVGGVSYWAGNRLNIYHALLLQKSLLEQNSYCDQNDDSGSPRKSAWPYANIEDADVDGSSLEKAFTICTKRQLMSMREEDFDKHFLLKNNIDWNDKSYLAREMIGEHWNNSKFEGKFYGLGHSILGIDLKLNWSWGLFKELGRNSSVSNLFVRGAKINSNGDVGAIAIRSQGSLNFIEVEAELKGNGVVGGLVAFHDAGKIRKSYFEGRIKNIGGRTGGISGIMSNGSSINQSAVRAHITANGTGGISGFLGTGTAIERSYSNIKIYGDRSGGIAAEFECGATIRNSLSSGRVFGAQSAGVAYRQSNANIFNVISTVKDFDNFGRIGAVHRVLDNLETSIGGTNNWYYDCTGSQMLPPPTIQSGCFYHDEARRVPRDSCVPKLMRQLTSKMTYRGWDFNFIWTKKDSQSAVLQDIPRSNWYYHPNL